MPPDGGADKKSMIFSAKLPLVAYNGQGESFAIIKYYSHWHDFFEILWLSWARPREKA